jgi:hypothetical protein
MNAHLDAGLLLEIGDQHVDGLFVLGAVKGERGLPGHNGPESKTGVQATENKG